mmetsp:Transcript_41653/g.130091  ORF Transcript_41653/g.130091 Transcript_41653/m.130091 type:complete len:820 (+) Transcript_41653:39-2498(+)
MAKSEPSFPFGLTFCRPWHVAAARDSGPRQLFGIVEDGSKQCSITDWPQPSLPFPLHPRRTLFVRIFVAEDRPAFERGEAEELGSCCLPLWRLPEVLPPASQEPPKLWLALEAPQGRRRPGVPATPAGGADLREESELLERFERSRELAANNLQVPRICILVHAQQGSHTPPSSFAPPRRQSAGSSPSRGVQTASPSPRPESSEEIWRAKFEEERHHYEERRRQCQRDIRAARAAVQPVSQKLEALSCFATGRLHRRWMDATFDSWCTWVAGEKCRRQFEQVNDELEGLGQDRKALAVQRTRSRAKAEARWREQEAQLRRRSQRWIAFLAASEALLASDAGAWVARGCLAAWRSWTTLFAAAHRIVQERQEVLAWQQLAVVLVVWCAAVGQNAVADLRREVEGVKAQVPLRARRAAAALASSASAWTGPEREEPSRDILLAWARTARRRALLRSQAAAVLDSSPWRSLDALFLECCLLLWRGAVGNIEAAVAAERSAGREFVQLYRQRVPNLLRSSHGACQVGSAMAVLMSWHFFATQCALQRALERAFGQHQEVRGKCLQWREELDRLRADHGKERARWQGDQDGLFEELCQVQRLQEQETRASEEGLASWRSTELQEATASKRSRVLADELADMRAQTLRAQEQLELAEADAEATMFDAQRRREACAEESAAARLDVQPLQQEAARLLEKRQGDLRTARQQARAQLARQEGSARRLITMHEEEQDAWEQKMRQSEARVGRLEQEVQQMQQSRRASKQEEPERADLLAEIMAAEQRLETFEDGERARRQELTTLRGAHSELQVQHAGLERRRSAALRA